MRTELTNSGDSQHASLANVVYAAAISTGVASSGAKRHGRRGLYRAIPAALANSAETLSYPTSSATFTVALFSESASA